MTEQTETLDPDAWYTWEEDSSEQGWLLSYVDVLSVILAMLLVLLVSRLQPETPAVSAAVPLAAAPAEAPAAPVRKSAVTEPATGLPFVPLTAALPPPDARPIPAPLSSGVPADLRKAPITRTNDAAAPAAGPVPASPEPAVDGIKVLRDHGAVTLQIAETVLFDSARAELKAGAAPALERAVLLLREFGDAEVAVQGHTDNRPVQGGIYRSNWALGAARADAVADFLLQQGFPPEKIRLESYADTRPIADNDTDAGRASNRRVELRVELAPEAPVER